MTGVARQRLDDANGHQDSRATHKGHPTSTTSPVTIQSERLRANRRAGYTAFAWVVVFLAWHVLWYVTGLNFPTSSHFHGTALEVYWVVDGITDVMFVAGCVLPLALVQRWGNYLPRWLLLAAAWIATGVLTLRGVSGILDDLLRAAGFSRGLTGLAMAQTADTTHVTIWVWVSGVATDVLFTAGAVVFGIAAVAYGRLRGGSLPRRPYTADCR